jgi:hypothetical protein
MTIDMTTIAGMVRRHGVDVDDRRVAEAVEDALAHLLTPPYAVALSGSDRAALMEGGLEFAAGERDYAAAVERTVGQYAALIANSIPVALAATRMGVTRPRVQQMLTKGELWGIRVEGRWLLPLAQFASNGRPLPGLPEVLSALRANGRHPLTVLAFLTAPQPELVVDGAARAPLEWLADGGRADDVLPLVVGIDVVG